MRAAVGIGNGVGEAEHLVVVAVVVLQHALRHSDLDVLVVEVGPRASRNDDRLGMEQLLVLVRAA